MAMQMIGVIATPDCTAQSVPLVLSLPKRKKLRNHYPQHIAPTIPSRLKIREYMEEPFGGKYITDVYARKYLIPAGIPL